MPLNYKFGGMPRQNIILYVIAWLLLSAGGFAFFYNLHSSIFSRELTSLNQLATKEILSAEGYCTTILLSAENNLKLISDGNYMHTYIRQLHTSEGNTSRKTQAEEELVQFLLKLLKINPNYYSIRFIDCNGMERIKLLNTLKGQKIIPQSELQNISKSYYFIDCLKTERNSIYYSKIDLQRTNGNIDFPFKPTLRVGKNVYSATGEVKGFILINLSLKLALPQHLAILNQSGDWLVGGGENWMNFEFNQKENFKTIYPQAWETISTHEFGNIVLNNNFFKFTTLRPPSTDESINWKIISRHIINPDKGTTSVLALNTLILLFFIFEAILIIIIIIFYIRQYKLYKYQHIIETNLELYDISLAVGRAMSWIYTPSTQKFTCSKHIERLLGIPSESFLTIKHVEDLFNKKNNPHIEDFFTFINSQRTTEDNNEFSIEHKIPLPKQVHNISYSEIWLKTYAIRLRDNVGENVIYGISFDITNRVLLEQSSIESRKASEKLSLELQNLLDESERLRLKAEEASSAKANFLANISHEIRTPMNSIIGMISLLEETNITPEQSEFIYTIRHSSEALLMIINDILDHSKIESGRLEIINEPFNLRDTLSHILEMIKPTVTSDEVEISSYFNADIPEILIGDELRITQILLNIASNAVKFTDSGTIHFAVNLLSISSNRVTLEIKVSDTGIGIAQEALDTIFEKFTQADQSTTRKFGGTGLGLSICKSLVEMMDGSISVESKLGEATTFTLILPLSLELNQTQLPLPEPSEHSPEKTDLALEHCIFPNTKILLCEDNEMNQKLCLKFLERLETTADIAANGLIALDLFNSRKYDLILMDLQMPELSGISATRRIRKIEKENNLPPVPIIAVTANIFDNDRNACFKAGMNGFLAKPVSLKKFKEALFSFLPEEFRQQKISTSVTIKGEDVQTPIPRLDPADIIDFKSGEAHSGGEQIYKTMIDIFINDTPGVITNIKKSTAEKSFEDATRFCHTLKSMAGIIGAKKLQQTSYNGEHSPDISALLTLIPEIEQDALATISALKEYLASKESSPADTGEPASSPDAATATLVQNRLNIDEIDESDTKIIDRDLGVHNSGCEDNFHEMLQIFSKEAELLLQDIKFESINGNPETTYRQIHTLKSMASIIGASRLYTNCSKAEVSNDCYVVQQILPILQEDVSIIIKKIPEYS